MVAMSEKQRRHDTHHEGHEDRDDHEEEQVCLFAIFAASRSSCPVVAAKRLPSARRATRLVPSSRHRFASVIHRRPTNRTVDPTDATAQPTGAAAPMAPARFARARDAIDSCQALDSHQERVSCREGRSQPEDRCCRVPTSASPAACDLARLATARDSCAEAWSRCKPLGQLCLRLDRSDARSAERHGRRPAGCSCPASRHRALARYPGVTSRRRDGRRGGRRRRDVARDRAPGERRACRARRRRTRPPRPAQPASRDRDAPDLAGEGSEDMGRGSRAGAGYPLPLSGRRR